MKTCSIDVILHWYTVNDKNDPRLRHSLGLYAYLDPSEDTIYYIGKCDGTTMRGRASYTAKPRIWDSISELSQHHRMIVAEIAVQQRLTRELLSDIEALLIYKVHQIQPLHNRQNTSSRGVYSRPGMRITCRGAWPLSKKVFWDE